MDIEALRREVESLADPLANALPLASDERLREMSTDIQSVGQREPIWLGDDGKIIDGRNRWIACKLAGVECKSMPLPADMRDRPAALVTSYNLMRRDLSLEDRALGAGRLANLGHGSNRFEAKVDSATEPSAAKPPPVSLDEAAKIFGVSPGSAKRGRAIVKSVDPELERDVRAGKMSLAAAASKATGVAHEKPNRERRPAMPPVVPIRERPVLVHDATTEIAEQVCSLLLRFREVSQKIGPEELYAKFPARLRHNLDIALADANFFVGDLHGAWAKDQTKKNAAV